MNYRQPTLKVIAPGKCMRCEGYMLEPIFEEEFSCSRCGLRLYWQSEEGLYEIPKPVQTEVTEAKETRPRLGHNNDKREMVSSTKIIKTIQEYRQEASS